MLLVCLAAAGTVAARLVHRSAHWARRRRAARRDARILADLDLDLAFGPAGDPVTGAGDRPLQPTFGRIPTFERIVADLRRLSAQRAGVGTRSHLWRRAILAAYDERLRMACRCLGVTEHLAGLDGADLALERIRVEDELRAAGLPLPVSPPVVPDQYR